MTAPLQLSLLKGVRQKGTRPPLALERATHIALVDTLENCGGFKPGWELLHIPNGELRTEKTGALLKRMGTKAGALDLEIFGPTGLAGFLELKRGRAPLTEAQKAFIARMEARGVRCAVARSYKEAIAILKDWGAVRIAL